MAKDPPTALVIVMSPITRDPRVRRQIDWLTEAGWVVDTVGPAGHHVPEAREHFGLEEAPPWVTTRFGSALIYGLLPKQVKFRMLTQNRIPAEAGRRIGRGYYDLVLFNDHHFLPWIADKKTFTPAALARHIHLDVHEYVTPRVKRDSLWRLFAGPYYGWIRKFIGDPRFTTRSTVVSAIAEVYAQEFNIPTPAVIRSCPPYVDQRPSEVRQDHIELIHHGAANGHRGIYEMIDAMRLADDRFTLTLMLVGGDEAIAVFKEYARDLGNRVRFADAVPMRDIAVTINPFDLEVMFFPPRTRNLEFALPNKLFEAVQGRLGLVIGESRMMAEVIDRYHNGVIASGWEGADLARALNSLSADEVARMKSASDAAAHELSAEVERVTFFATITGNQQ